MGAIMVDLNNCFLKIAVSSRVNVGKLLRVPVCQWKPGALYLYHQAMALFKCVGNIRQRIFYLAYFSGNKGFRVFVAVPELAPHNFAPHQHLVATHGIVLAVAF